MALLRTLIFLTLFINNQCLIGFIEVKSSVLFFNMEKNILFIMIVLFALSLQAQSRWSAGVRLNTEFGKYTDQQLRRPYSQVVPMGFVRYTHNKWSLETGISKHKLKNVWTGVYYPAGSNNSFYIIKELGEISTNWEVPITFYYAPLSSPKFQVFASLVGSKFTKFQYFSFGDTDYYPLANPGQNNTVIYEEVYYPANDFDKYHLSANAGLMYETPLGLGKLGIMLGYHRGLSFCYKRYFLGVHYVIPFSNKK